MNDTQQTLVAFAPPEGYDRVRVLRDAGVGFLEHATFALADLPREGSELVDEYRDKFANPYIAAERGYVDEVIAPAGTRQKLITALSLLATKRDKNPPRKHGNIPL